MIVVGASPGGRTVDSGPEVVNGLEWQAGNDLKGLKFEIFVQGAYLSGRDHFVQMATRDTFFKAETMDPFPQRWTVHNCSPFSRNISW